MADEKEEEQVVLVPKVREVFTQEEVDEAEGTVRYADGTVRNAAEVEKLKESTKTAAEAEKDKEAEAKSAPTTKATTTKKESSA